jgi:hypothetical protein
VKCNFRAKVEFVGLSEDFRTRLEAGWAGRTKIVPTLANHTSEHSVRVRHIKGPGMGG